MRRNIYNHHQQPRLMTDLVEGDFVWGVNYSSHPSVAKYKVVGIGRSVDKDFFHFELELVEDYSTEGPGWRRYSCWWYEKSNCEITRSQYSEDTKIVCSKKYRCKKFFSDETVMRHSLWCYIWKLKKEEWGRLKKIQRHMEYLFEVEKKMKESQ